MGWIRNTLIYFFLVYRSGVGFLSTKMNLDQEQDYVKIYIVLNGM